MAFAWILNLQHPIYALISAVVVTDLSSAETRKMGPARMGATLLGAGLGAIINSFGPHNSVGIGLGVFTAIFLSRLVQLRDSKVAGYVCGIVLLDHGGAPWTYAFFRMIETALGIGVAFLISVVPKFIRR